MASKIKIEKEVASQLLQKILKEEKRIFQIYADLEVLGGMQKQPEVWLEEFMRTDFYMEIINPKKLYSELGKQLTEESQKENNLYITFKLACALNAMDMPIVIKRNTLNRQNLEISKFWIKTRNYWILESESTNNSDDR